MSYGILERIAGELASQQDMTNFAALPYTERARLAVAEAAALAVDRGGEDDAIPILLAVAQTYSTLALADSIDRLRAASLR